MEEERALLQSLAGSLRRKRALRTKKGAAYSLYQPALNLSLEEYDRFLEEIKKRGTWAEGVPGNNSCLVVHRDMLKKQVG